MGNVIDRVSTWAMLGEETRECKNIEQVLAKSGLGYTVSKQTLYAGTDDTDYGINEVPNRFITVRDTDHHMYDVVSDKFEIVQNADAFDFVNYMRDEISFEKAGETRNGMVYIIGALPEMNILGDAFTPYILFRNGFNGKVKITAAVCPLRVICQNQFNFAFKSTQNTVVVRHVQNAHTKLEEAREVLKTTTLYMQELNGMAEKYAAQKLSPGALDKVLDLMFPIKNKEGMNAYALHKLMDARDRLTTAYNADDNSNFKGTAWGLINAYTDFLTHAPVMGRTETKEEGRFIRVTFGQPMNGILSAIAAIAA